MPQYQVVFETSDGKRTFNVDFGDDELIADVLQEIGGELEEKGGLTPGALTAADAVVLWSGEGARRLDPVRTLPEQGVRPNDVLVIKISTAELRAGPAPRPPAPSAAPQPGSAQARLRVFVSSTSLDLAPFRDAAFKAIHGLGGYADDMAFWAADGHAGADLSLTRVRQSDVLVLILAHRYGHVPAGTTQSITEMEYDAARQSGIPVLAFLLDEDVPWPPKYMERDHFEQLQAFRGRLAAEVSYKTFQSADHLAALVTQAVAVLMQASAAHPNDQRFRGDTLRVDSAAILKAVPNALIEIGTSEDDLPLLMAVERLRDIEPLMKDLVDAVDPLGGRLPQSLVDEVHRSFRDHAWRAAAEERIAPVQPASGRGDREMYISKNTLSTLFTPLFAAILESNRRTRLRRKPNVHRREHSTTAVASFADVRKVLQSVGGANRFLGIALDDGGAFSVGRLADTLVTWRRFYFESLAGSFPDASFEMVDSNGRGLSGRVGDGFRPAIEKFARRSRVGAGGIVDATVSFEIPRSSVAAVIDGIAGKLMVEHAAGHIHGDVKPGNVILTPGTPTLIDEFNLESGELSPGWTPEWSAPEQVLGSPVAYATDVYPLGVMVARLLGGTLVGEVRKFRTPPLENGQDEFDVFYDPFVFISPQVAALGEGSRASKEWCAFARGCLRFDPDRRIQSAAAFREEFWRLTSHYPLEGSIRITIERPLAAARLVDGTEVVARVITDR